MFTSTIGTPIDESKILKEFNSLVTAAKLPKTGFLDSRYACVSLLGAQGVPLKVIAGHSDIRLTQNIYQRVYQESKREAASKMDELLTKATAPDAPVATCYQTSWKHLELGFNLLILWSHPPGLNRRPADYEYLSQALCY